MTSSSHTQTGKGKQISLGAKMPAVNVAETDKAIEITAELLGVEQKDIKIDIDGNRLVVSGEKKQETKRDEKPSSSEEVKIIRLVRESYLSARQNLEILVIARSSVYRLIIVKKFRGTANLNQSAFGTASRTRCGAR